MTSFNYIEIVLLSLLYLFKGVQLGAVSVGRSSFMCAACMLMIGAYGTLLMNGIVPHVKLHGGLEMLLSKILHCYALNQMSCI